MTYSKLRRSFLRNVAVSGAAVGLETWMPNALAAACPPSQVCPPPAPTTASGFLIQRTGVTYPTLQEAANKAQNGDAIYVTPGVYAGNVNCASINVSVALRSAIPGQKWRIDTSGERKADGSPNFQGSQAKGLIVKQSGCTQLLIEDCEFVGAPLIYNNFAGLWTEGGNWQVTLRDCYFRGCDNGILLNNALSSNPLDTSNIVLDGCVFEGCGDFTGSTHNIYAGAIASLTMTGCYSARCNFGHLLKTRAKQTTLLACRFTGESGTDSFAADFSNAGDVLILGCIFEQGIQTDNPVLITYGRELQFWTQVKDNRINRFRMYQSTVVNDLGSGRPLYMKRIAASTSQTLAPSTVSGQGIPSWKGSGASGGGSNPPSLPQRWTSTESGLAAATMEE